MTFSFNSWEDIFRIRSGQNEFILAKAFLLFESKWRWKYNNEEIDEFIDYFKSKLCSDRNYGYDVYMEPFKRIFYWSNDHILAVAVKKNLHEFDHRSQANMFLGKK